MKRVNQYDFYSLATVVHPLTEIRRGSTVGQNLYILVVGQQQLKALLSAASAIVPLRVARGACAELVEYLTAILPAKFGEEEMNKPLEDWRVNQIAEAARQFETVLAAELPTLDTYFVAQKGAYSTSDLIERAEIMLPEEIRALLPTIVIEDVQQAGRSLVFDLPTAAGFHIMRATESVIRLYYQEVVGKKPKTKHRDWGAYVKTLQTSGADPRITNAIDQIRDLHRNPLMHPEQALSESEALTLIGIAQSAIIAMVGDITKRRAVVATQLTAPVATKN